jgi:hypothetical protein
MRSSHPHDLKRRPLASENDRRMREAGTKEGIVSVWGSFGANPKKRLWRVTGLDLSQHEAGYIGYGVTREFAA